MTAVRCLLACVAVMVGGTALAQPAGLAVLRVGDGSAALSNAATAAFLDTFSLSGSSLGSVALSTGSNALTVSGTAASEGQITRSADGTRIAVPGYDAPVGTAAVVGTSSATVNRVVNAFDGAAVGRVASFATSFSANNIRGAYTADGAAAYAVGANTGVVSGPPETVISSTTTNNRVVNSFNGNLYYSTASGTARGVYQVGTGLPTAAGTASTLLIDTGATSSSYAFAISPNGATAYVADDATVANGGGVKKYTFDGTAWTLAGTFANLRGTETARGLTVDFSGANPTLYATTTLASNNALVSLTDLGSNYSDAFNVLATAGTNQAFRGVTFSVVPVPEPATVLAAAAAGLGGLRLVRRRVRGS